jgi:hypothetical protein
MPETGFDVRSIPDPVKTFEGSGRGSSPKKYNNLRGHTVNDAH